MKIEDVDTAIKIRNRIRDIDKHLEHLSRATRFSIRFLNRENYLTNETYHGKDGTIFEVTTSLISTALKKERDALYEDLSKI